MHLRQLSVNNFRSWPSVSVPLETGVTAFVGPNGHGKTNLLEAVGFLATLSSHRVSQDSPLIRTDHESATICATAHNSGRELTVDVTVNGGSGNRARINGSPCRRPAEILGVVHSVMFAPEDLSLVRGDPGERRRFLDGLVVQRRPATAGIKSDYEKVLKQRSALLKSSYSALRRGQGSDSTTAISTLDVWDQKLAEYGSQLLQQRLSTLDELTPFVVGAYHQLAPSSRAASLTYKSNLGDKLDRDKDFLEMKMLATLAERRQQEIDRGQCLVGPHRDDVYLGLGKEPAKGFASHGESWSFALALRLGSLELMRSRDIEPILLLDDVFAELDRHRRQALAAVACTVEQVLVTTAVAEDLPHGLDERKVNIRLKTDEVTGTRESIIDVDGI